MLFIQGGGAASTTNGITSLSRAPAASLGRITIPAIRYPQMPNEDDPSYVGGITSLMTILGR